MASPSCADTSLARMSPEMSIWGTLHVGSERSPLRRSHSWRFSRPDPRTLLCALIVFNAIALSAGTLTGIAVVGLGAMIAIATLQRRRMFFGATLAIAGFTSVYVLVPQVLSGPAAMSVSMAAFWGARFSTAIAWGAYVLAAVRPGELVASLNALRLPQAIVIPVAVMFRFIPVVRAEFLAVRDAMSLRGLDSTPKLIARPIQSIEYVLVPLLSSCTRIADDLAASALIRGLGSRNRPTSMTPLGFGMSDALLVVFMLVVGGLTVSGVQFLS